jgi:cytidine deaminase
MSVVSAAVPMQMLKALFAAAAAARANAYAPYSGFAVGAALRTPHGRIYAAANVENAAFPVGTCAEAGAIAAMVAAGDREISEILVLASSADPIMPCGACRQRIFEFATPATIVHAAGLEGPRSSLALADLLPRAFGPHNLRAEPSS